MDQRRSQTIATRNDQLAMVQLLYFLVWDGIRQLVSQAVTWPRGSTTAYLTLMLKRTLGSSIVAIGLNWYQATFVVMCSAIISGVCMAFNSRLAATYHVGYPVALRTCFGMYGHYWPVLARGVCAMFWVSVLRE
jgi:cytosine/uracil/thiamine/allantoin permease